MSRPGCENLTPRLLWLGESCQIENMTSAKPSKKPSKTAVKAAPVSVSTPAGKLEKLAKLELVEMIAQKTDLTKKRAGDAFNATLEVILETLKSGGKVGPPGFGTLEVRETKARNGVRPGTSERIEIPTGKKLAFKIASDLKADL